jgi:hypothetical protein
MASKISCVDNVVSCKVVSSLFVKSIYYHFKIYRQSIFIHIIFKL